MPPHPANIHKRGCWRVHGATVVQSPEKRSCALFGYLACKHHVLADNADSAALGLPEMPEMQEVPEVHRMGQRETRLMGGPLSDRAQTLRMITDRSCHTLSSIWMLTMSSWKAQQYVAVMRKGHQLGR